MMPATPLEEGLGLLALDLPASAQQQLLDYIALLEKWNRVYNLTAIRTREQMIHEHFGLILRTAHLRFPMRGHDDAQLHAHYTDPIERSASALA